MADSAARSTSVSGDAWLTPCSQERADHRLILFPHAGSGTAGYVRFARAFSGTGIVVSIVRYPGRETRLAESFPETMAALVSTLSAQLQGLADGPFSFFGHSMGALVAFELAGAWRDQGRPQPRQLWLSGRRAPQVPADLPHLHLLPDPALLEAVARRYEALPAALRAYPELVELLLPVLRADFRCIETYQVPGRDPLSLPFSILRGAEDRWLDAATASQWARHTRAPVTEQVFPGGHFYLDAVLPRIRELVCHAAAQPAAKA